jgi:hypothetical protein
MATLDNKLKRRKAAPFVTEFRDVLTEARYDSFSYQLICEGRIRDDLQAIRPAQLRHVC